MSETKTTERDFDAHPYSPDEKRVAAWLQARAPMVGTGDDPIGFVLASYETLWFEKKRLEEDLAFARRSRRGGEYT